MAEMNSLTLNEKKYDSFPDRKVRDSYIKNINFLYSITATKKPDDSEYEWWSVVPEPTEEKPYVWVRIDYTHYCESMAHTPPAVVETTRIAEPMLIGCFCEPVSAEAVEEAVAKWLEENPVEVPDLSDQVRRAEDAAERAENAANRAENAAGNGSGTGETVAEFEVDEETLNMNEGVLSVNTTNEVLEDDPRPITSGAVYEEFSKAVALLKTI